MTEYNATQNPLSFVHALKKIDGYRWQPLNVLCIIGNYVILNVASEIRTLDLPKFIIHANLAILATR